MAKIAAKRKAAAGVTVHDFRLSFIWAVTLLFEQPPSRAPFAKRATYEKMFDALNSGGPAQGLGLPWPRKHPYAHKFWSHYLGLADPSRASASMAWAKALPFRAETRLADVGAQWFPGRVSIERYFYPFGLGLIVTFAGTSPLRAYDWIAHAQATRSKQLEVQFGSDRPLALALPALSSEFLTRMQDAYFTRDPLLASPPNPFAIMTVIRADGVDESVAPTDGDETHRFLFGAAQLRKNWETANLASAPLKDSALDIKGGASPGDLAFATKNSRVIWFPSSFTNNSPVSSLSCYHRNQLFGALQVESLCSLAATLRARIVNDPNLPGHLDQLGPIAGQLLAEIYDGQNTYRSMSLRKQIDDRGTRSDIAALRLRYGLAKWPKPASARA